jgi:hypothetical protein
VRLGPVLIPLSKKAGKEFIPRSRRDTRCFKTCMTVEGVPLAGSLMSR